MGGAAASPPVVPSFLEVGEHRASDRAAGFEVVEHGLQLGQLRPAREMWLRTRPADASAINVPEDLRLWAASPGGSMLRGEVPHNRERDVAMSRWEYMTLDCTKPKDDIEALDKIGLEGWEAVAMVSTWGYQKRFVHPMVLLKRPLAEAAS